MSSLALPPFTPAAGFRQGAHHRPPAARRWAPLLLIAAAHALALAWLLQLDVVKKRLAAPTPVAVWLLPAPAARPTPPPPAAAPRRVEPRPLLAVPSPPPLSTPAELPPRPAEEPAPVPPTATAPAAAPAPTPRAEAPVAPAQVASVPAAPRLQRAGAIRYRVPPAIEVPIASRRLGEAGTVLLRVLVDAQGLPRQITLHRSSGFARLDEQALAAMRQARFQPLVEGGSAVEWLVIAPLQYEVDEPPDPALP